MKFANKMLALGLVCTLMVLESACFTVDQVLSDVDLLVQTSTAICQSVGSVSPQDAAACQVLATVAEAGLTSVRTTYDAYEQSGAVGDLAKVRAAITAIQQNLPQELAASRISDPRAVQKASAWVNLIVTSLNDVLTLIPQLTPTTTTAQVQLASLKLVKDNPAAAKRVATMSAKSLRARWASEICGGEATCSARVNPRPVHRGKSGKTLHYLTLGIKK